MRCMICRSLCILLCPMLLNTVAVGSVYTAPVCTMLYSSCICSCVQFMYTLLCTASVCTIMYTTCLLFLYSAPTYRASHPPKVKTSGNVIIVDWADCFDINAEVKEFVLYKDEQVEYSGYDSEFSVYRQSQYESKSLFRHGCYIN